MLNGLKLDAAAQVFIATELQAIEAELHETMFGPKKAAELIPIEVDIPRGAREWGYDRITMHGIAEWLASDASKIPMAEVESTRVLFPLKELGAGFYYSLSDMNAAQMYGMPLERTKARAAREAVDRKENNTWLTGDTAVGFEGLINNSNVTAGNVANPISVASTPAEILAVLHAEYQSVFEATKEVYVPNTIALPLTQYGYIHTTPRSDNSDVTIAEYFKRNHPGVEFKSLAELAGAGAGATDRMITYKRDPQVVVAKACFLFEQLPPQEKGYGFNVPTWGKIGGCIWRVPIAGKYGDNV